MAERIEAAFEEHYTRTSTEPDTWEYTLISDKESDYVWERHGEPVIQAIENAAEIPEPAARDIQLILQDEHYSHGAAEIGEETEFDSESYYEEKGTDDVEWQEEWRDFERALKTEARFFSQSAAAHLASVFEGIDTLRAHDGRPLITQAGPGTDMTALFRARVFQSQARLEEALKRPERNLESPPSMAAAPGGLNARGCSVYYGANDPLVALSEVRPPVGARVAIARFEIIRPIKLLDLTAVGDVAVEGSIFDPTLGARLERAMFLRNLSSRIIRPVMPDDEPFEYLPTQAVADFLATESKISLDGIIYPSVQVAGETLNIVLFHRAAWVERLKFPKGTDISARSGDMYEEGWETDYTVWEEVPAEEYGPHIAEAIRPWNFFNFAEDDREPVERDLFMHEPTLRVDLEAIYVHHVEAVQFQTTPHRVHRHRFERPPRVTKDVPDLLDF